MGNALYLRGSSIDALHAYIKALTAVRGQKADNSADSSPAATAQLAQLEIDLLNNCAAACLALKVPEGAALAAAYARRAAQAAQVAGDEQRAHKALVREGKALLAMHRYVRGHLLRPEMDMPAVHVGKIT